MVRHQGDRITVLRTCVIICVLLVSCIHQEGNVLIKSDKRICRATCKQQAVICAKHCRNQCSQCTAFFYDQAVKNYSRYLKEQDIKGAVITRELQSYRDPLQCRKTTCNCTADYYVCMQSCGGIIYKQLQAAPVC